MDRSLTGALVWLALLSALRSASWRSLSSSRVCFGGWPLLWVWFSDMGGGGLSSPPHGGNERMRSNNALERTGRQRGRAVLAMNGVLAGAEWAPCLAAQLSR